MNKIKAFVGHSFLDEDTPVVNKFLNFFNKVRDLGIGFSWEHAEEAEIKVLSEKVKEKMQGKTLFIGICTKRDLAINLVHIKPCVFQQNLFKGLKHNFEWKTTEWIVQEIGFALGKEMDLILLVEDGIQRLGGLQGDIEYIPFNRGEPEKSFPKILEMLRSLIPKEVDSGEIPVSKNVGQKIEGKEPIEEKIIASSDATPESRDVPLPEESWGKEEFENAIIKAIFLRDREADERLYSLYVNCKAGNEESKRVDFDALRLYYQHVLYKCSNLEKMIVLQNKYPKNYKVNIRLGNIYQSYQEYEKASNYFYLSVSCATEDGNKLAGLTSTAYSLAKAGSLDKANRVLDEARNIIGSVEEHESRLMLTMADIAKMNKDTDNYLALLEGYLDNKPENHDERFNIAYKYSENGQNDLALYHYIILSNRNPGETIFNNMGVAYGNLGFHYKEVKSFRESERLGGTLAMSNLANNFINAGFLDEAADICDKAVKIENYDRRVGEKINRIKEVKNQEDESEQKILDKTKNRRDFYTKYAHYFTKKPVPNMTGLWESATCKLNISVKQGNFEALGTYEKKEPGVAYTFGLTSTPSPPTIKKINIKYTGIMNGHAIRYMFEEDEEGMTRTLLSIPKKRSGLMILSDDLSEIEVCEKEDQDKYIYYSIRKL